MAKGKKSDAIRGELSFFHKLSRLRWGLIALLCLLASFGFTTLYSAADGSFEPWAWRQMEYFALGFVAMLGVARVNLQTWRRYAYLSYGMAVALLIAVELIGTTAMGAQRWLDLGVVRFQPVDLMRLSLVLGLARYFSALSPSQVRRPSALIAPLCLVLVPAALMLRQPDLSSAVLIVIIGLGLLYLAGVRFLFLGVMLVSGLIAMPLAWQILRHYQKERVLVFFDPAYDTLGTGYQILQAKIAVGSGGIFGKGFLAGIQSHNLYWLPERQTDFIFAVLAEEFGLVGTLTVLGVYLLIVVRCVAISRRSTSQFGRLLGMGLTTSFFIHVFVNVAVVTGLVPVTGVPLPLISYGGTVMVGHLVGFGLLMSTYVHRDAAGDETLYQHRYGASHEAQGAAVRSTLFSRRTTMLAGGKLVLLSLLAGRLYYLQVASQEYSRYR